MEDKLESTNYHAVLKYYKYLASSGSTVVKAGDSHDGGLQFKSHL